MPIPPFSSTTPNASASIKGKLQLAGDLGGTAAAPLVKRTVHIIVAPHGYTGPADYICASSTGNESEINSAITAANALTNGAVVELLEGNYTVSGSIIPLNNVWLRGQGMFATRIGITSSANVAIIGNRSVYSGPATPYTNGIISDMFLDGSNMNPAVGSKAIDGTCWNNCKIMRVYAQNTTATGIGCDDLYGSSITECCVVNCGYTNKHTVTGASWAASVFTYTVPAHGYSVGNAIVITGMTPVLYNGTYKVTSVVDADNFTIASSNNSGLNFALNPGTATGFGVTSTSAIGNNGFGVASGSNYSEATLVTNNIAIGNQNNNFLIEADASTTGQIASYIYSNNISINAGNCGYLNTGTINAQFNNNFDYGSPIGMSANPVSTSKTVTAASWSTGVATFTTSTTHGFSVGQQASIINMTPTGYNGYFYIDSVPTTTTFTVAITANPGTATVFGSAAVVFHPVDGSQFIDNVLAYNRDYGMKFSSSAHNLMIKNNTVKFCYNYGIYFNSSKSQIIGNNVHDCGQIGIDLITGGGSYTPMQHVEVGNNLVYNNGTRVNNSDGMKIDSSSTALISDITVHDNHLFDDQETKTQRYGLFIPSGGLNANIFIHNNDFIGNATGAALIQDTTNTIYVFNNGGVNPNGESDLGNITGSTTFDPSIADFFTATLTGNVTAVMPTPAVGSMTMTWVLVQDGTGSWTLSIPANATSGTTLTLSTAASAIDVLTWAYDNAGGKWRLVSKNLGNNTLNTLSSLTITTPNSGNVTSLAVTQNDTTNNPSAQVITNAGTGHALDVIQNGVLATNKFALYVNSNAANVNSPLAWIRSTNASTTKDTLQLDNAGSGNALDINSGNAKLADAVNIVLGTSTGSKIGTGTTQKLGFYNATPIVQPSGDLVTALGNLGLVTSGTVALAATVTTNANLTGPITSSGNATSIASQTGTGTKFVVDTSPTLVTPTLGVATVTSINKVAFTAPTTAATFAFGTDNTTQTFQGTDTIVGRATTDTLTNKRITRRVSSTASSATPTPNGDTTDVYEVTALAAGATFGAPTGTPLDGDRLVIRIKDNGSAQTLAWNAIYRFSSDLAAPTTTVISKTLYLGFIYNGASTTWDCLALLNNF